MWFFYYQNYIDCIYFIMYVADLHNDFLTEIKTEKQQIKYLSTLPLAAKHIVCAVWTSKLKTNEILSLLYSANETINSLNMKSTLKIAIEDFWFVSKDNYQLIKKIKPIYVGLTWNNNNLLAGGAMENGEVTKLGEYYINKLNRDKITIDTSHLNEKSFMQVASLSRKIICSHTAFSGVYDCYRNLKDYQIRTIIDMHGIIGLCFVSDFLNGTKHATIEDVCKHIEYFFDRFGDDNICLGTDFYGSKHLPKGIKNYENISKIKELLIKKGYSEKSVAKLFYRNYEKFIGV